jgi:hypothetical protein
MARSQLSQLIAKSALRSEEEECAQIEDAIRDGNTHNAILRSLSNHLHRNLRQIPRLLLQHSRLLGHVGEYGEAIRICDEVRASDASPALQARALTWAAIYWSRLGELKVSDSLLLSCPRDTMDLQTEALSLVHLLSNAIETRDLATARSRLDMVEPFRQRLARDAAGAEDARAEVETWVSLFSIALAEKPSEGSVDAAIKCAEDQNRENPNVARLPYVYLWAGRLYAAAGCAEKVASSYGTAGKLSLDCKAYLTFVRAALEEVELRRRAPKPDDPGSQDLTERMVLMAGQIGLGLLPCALLGRILRAIDSSKQEQRLLRWLIQDRYLPDIGRLVDVDFEDWCLSLLRRHPRLLGDHRYVVEKIGGSNPGFDLIARYEKKNAFGDVEAKDYVAIECKGGISSTRKGDLSIEKLTYSMVKAQQDFKVDRFAWITSAPLSGPSRAMLNLMGMKHFGRAVRIIDYGELQQVLVRDIDLQVYLRQHVHRADPVEHD